MFLLCFGCYWEMPGTLPGGTTNARMRKRRRQIATRKKAVANCKMQIVNWGLDRSMVGPLESGVLLPRLCGRMP